ncbi:hypothetical protein [Albimonas donghaensis]|uniref:hypothetical protein n=1 Tax=Albimonas donghaensis TaxID=356660 RepID=UPI000B84E7B3|nr:hypothetical protein [Albimonas donghaensis]
MNIMDANYAAEERGSRSIIALGSDSRGQFHLDRPKRDRQEVRAILASNTSTAPLEQDLVDGLILDVSSRPERVFTCCWPREQTETELTLVVDDPANDALHVAHFSIGFPNKRGAKGCVVEICSVGMLLRCDSDWLARWVLEPGQNESIDVVFDQHGQVNAADLSLAVGRGRLAAQQVANMIVWIGDLLFSQPRRDVIDAVVAKIAAEEAGWLSVPLTAKQADLSEQFDRRA